MLYCVTHLFHGILSAERTRAVLHTENIQKNFSTVMVQTRLFLLLTISHILISLYYLYASGFSFLKTISSQLTGTQIPGPRLLVIFFLFEKLSFPFWHEIHCFCQAFVSLQGLCKTHPHWCEMGRQFRKVAAQLSVHLANAKWRLVPSFFLLEKNARRVIERQ